jgi:hypothetical protein
MEILEDLMEEDYAKIEEKAAYFREDETDTEILVLSLTGILKRDMPDF